MEKLDPRIFRILKEGTAAQRKYVFLNSRHGRIYFAMYYCPHYFTHGLAPFHYQFNDDMRGLHDGTLDEVAWIGFRECAKTSFAKTPFVLYDIVFALRRFIIWDSQDGGNSEAAIFDIANELQTNKRLIADFGRLYSKRKKKQVEEEEEGQAIRRLDKFITEKNADGLRVRVESFSTQQSPRGRLWMNMRPDLWVLDDIENEITIESWKITQKVVKHIDALKAGMAPGAVVLYLGNYLLEGGTITHVMDTVKGLGSRGVVRFVPLLDARKQVAWPKRYAMTDEEANARNQGLPDPKKRVLSVEAKKRTLGPTAFATEMMLEPGSDADYYFDRTRIKELMLQARDPDRSDGGFKFWGKYDARHAYSAGTDHASGIGRDHSTLALIDVSRKPAAILATFKDNEIGHETFAHAVNKHVLEPFGSPFIVPEANMGYGFIAELVRDKADGGVGYSNVYVREVKNRTNGKPMNTYGFWTSGATRPDILSQLRAALQDGDLVSYDLEFLESCYRFTNKDARELKPTEGQTRHFDDIIAAALAWEGRYQARPGGEEGAKAFKNTVQKRGQYEM